MMTKIADILTGTSTPSLLHTLMEPRAAVEPLGLGLMAPVLCTLPKGDGHPVLVLPGFTAGDSETYLLRQFLNSRNYRVHGWKMGRNVGPMAGLEKRIVEKVRSLAEEYGTKVSIIGWSLGGLFARYVAHEVPDLVRSVISLGSPLGCNQDMSGLSPLVNLLARGITAYEFTDLVDDISLHRWNHTPPVPTTAVYSRADGLIHWSAACDPLEHDRAENVHVPGSHCGLPHNALVFAVVADRLAQPDGNWQPFEHRGVTGLVGKFLEPFKGTF